MQDPAEEVEFWVIRDRMRSGPFSEGEVLRAYREGELKATDRLWAAGVPTTVSVAEAFAQLRGQEPVGEIDLTLVPADEPSDSDAVDASPYRRPRAAVDGDYRGKTAVRYAGFWVRCSADILDTIILLVAFSVLGLVLGVLAAILPLGRGMDFLITFGIPVGGTALYFILAESGPASATWGKRAFHLQVLGAEYLDRISFLRATGRLAGRYLSSLLLMIGYLMQPFNARKRALHDFLAGTVVVVEHPYSRGLVAAMIVLGLVLPGIAVLAVVVPGYQQYAARQKVSDALRQVKPATLAIQRHLAATGRMPESLAEAGFDTSRRLPGVRHLSLDPDSGAITVTLAGEPAEGRTVLVLPVEVRSDAIVWGCQPGTLPPTWLPAECPPPD
jgi:uncharacterized RDD family membrane protein YckC/Tfp pilus assembly major pilin PilA